MLYVADTGETRRIDPLNYWDDAAPRDWRYIGEAIGDVTVPAGSYVRLALNKRAGNDLSPLIHLRPDDIYELWIGDSADDRCLRYVSHLTGLKRLDFPRSLDDLYLPECTPAGLRELAKLKSLERLIAPKHLSDAGLAALAEGLPDLKTLFAFDHHLTNDGLGALLNMRSLEKLVIGEGRLTDEALDPLSRLTSLRFLSLSGYGFTDNAVLQARRIPGLKTLLLPATITDAGLAHLAGHPTLENLSLDARNITDSGVIHLKRLPALKRLGLDTMQKSLMTDAATAHLKEMKSLVYLRLPCIGLTEEGLANLSELDRLDYLWVDACSGGPVNDARLRHLTRLRSLETLHIGGKGITAAGLSSIAELKKLRELYVAPPEVTAEGLAALGKLSALQHLVLFTGEVTFSALNRLNGLPDLKHLEVNSVVDDGAVLNLGRLPQLQNLRLACAKGSSFNEDDFTFLAELKRLRSLDMSGIGDAGITHLIGLRSLWHLSTGGPGLTDRGLGILASLPALTSVSIGGRFSDAGLQSLEELTGLQSLTLSSTMKISTAAKERLRKRLPNLVIFRVEEGRGAASRPAVGSRPGS